MENVLSGWKLAVGLILTMVVIGMAMTVSDKGEDSLKRTTGDVAESAQIIANTFLDQFNNRVVSYEDVVVAVQDYGNDYEIRYQTLEHKDAHIDYKIYPGTEKDNRSAVAFSNVVDKNSVDYLNPDANWYATINSDNGYILFRQEKN